MTTREILRRISMHRSRGTEALERYGNACADLRQARLLGECGRARASAAAVEEARQAYVRAVGSAQILQSLVEERRVARERRA